MKYFSLLTLFALAMTYSTIYAQSNKGIPAIANHPRLLFLEGEEKALASAVKVDRYKQRVHHEILAECEEILHTVPVERIKVGMRMLPTSREAMLRIFYLSYSWRMTGDSRYVERAKDELHAISSFTDWNPSHFLDVAEMTIAAAIGYDWLYKELSPEERTRIKDAILKKGLEPSFDSRYNWWLKATHNWNQVCNAGMLLGALAIYEDDVALAEKIIERGKESIQLPMKDYEPDGAYPEGYMYWGYGTTFNVLFINAMERAFGQAYDLSSTPSFLETASFMQNMTGVTGDSFNFSDSDLGGVLQPSMFWFAQKTNNPSLLWVEREHMVKLSANVREDNRILPLTLIWSQDSDLQSIDPPKNRMWAGKGKTPVALMRSSWTDSSAIYVGFKGGSPSTNHGHMDVGSFVMESDGIRWAIDFGREDYRLLESQNINIWNFDQNSERWGVFKYSNLAHNTLTVNGELQNVKGYAPLIDFFETDDSTTATMDLSSLYPQLTTLKRNVTIANGEKVTIKDLYGSRSDESTIRWSMLTDATVSLSDAKTAVLTKDGKQLKLQVNVPYDILLKTWVTDRDYMGNDTQIVGFEIKVEPYQTGEIIVHLVPLHHSSYKKSNQSLSP
ncbi:heparinase II/III family protein [Sphingobacterium sp. SGR-19]|uniref:heparinase II/III domain-containing protein n=1 Tax=Sphingobacterium sp. SGR-19 TaxID=2710886 RepID=UPI0013EDE8AC|nr:heparinase II/III family protein [Sphingobacterium sp. SGR-19]NGM65821.1 alginate lyase family protein [Sphingobacterium sp. SGR-19]